MHHEIKKKRYAVGLSLLLLLSVFGWIGCQDSPVDETKDSLQSSDVKAKRGNNNNTIPFEEAQSFFEFNATDNDLGLQIFLDAENWEKVRVNDAEGKQIVQVLTQGALTKLGITELRFESAEPSPEEVLALFPAGEYCFTGITTEGEKLHSTAELSHDFLAAPTVTPSDRAEVDPENTIVSWNAPGAAFVEIIIENEDADNVFDATVDGDVTSLTIPPEFLKSDMEYKLEILAVAENGNRTIVETMFVTAEE